MPGLDSGEKCENVVYDSLRYEYVCADDGVVLGYEYLYHSDEKLPADRYMRPGSMDAKTMSTLGDGVEPLLSRCEKAVGALLGAPGWFKKVSLCATKKVREMASRGVVELTKYSEARCIALYLALLYACCRVHGIRLQRQVVYSAARDLGVAKRRVTHYIRKYYPRVAGNTGDGGNTYSASLKTELRGLSVDKAKTVAKLAHDIYLELVEVFGKHQAVKIAAALAKATLGHKPRFRVQHPLKYIATCRKCGHVLARYEHGSLEVTVPWPNNTPARCPGCGAVLARDIVDYYVEALPGSTGAEPIAARQPIDH